MILKKIWYYFYNKLYHSTVINVQTRLDDLPGESTKSFENL